MQPNTTTYKYKSEEIQLTKICIGLFLKGCGLEYYHGRSKSRLVVLYRNCSMETFKLFNNKIFEINDGKFMVHKIYTYTFINNALLNTIH